MARTTKHQHRTAPINSRFAVLIAVLVAWLAIMPAPAAHADGDPSKDVIRKLAITYELDERGDLRVTETFDWDFGDRNGLGFYRTLVQRMGYEPDRSKERVFEYTNFEVHSPSGAPAQVWIDNDQGTELRLSIGAPDGSSDTRTGVQTYVLSYDVRGAINPVRNQPGVSDQDELYYNVFTSSPNRVDQVDVQVTGPSNVVDSACYQGRRGSQDPCAVWTADGSSVEFLALELDAGHGLTIMAAFGAGTFSEPGPILVDRPFGAEAGDALRTGWPIVAGIWAVLLAGFGFVRVRLGRDRVYQGLAPGMLPLAGQQYPEVRLRGEPPVVNRPVPPEGLRPAEAIVITEEVSSTKAFIATLIDLAVRGFLTIEPIPTRASDFVLDWQLTLRPDAPPPDRLQDFERVLMNSVFANRRSVRISSLRGTFQPELAKFNQALAAHSDQRGWFTRPGLAFGKAGLAGLLIVGIAVGGIAAAVIGILLPQLHALLPLLIAALVAAVALLIVWIATAKAAHARSGRGRAHFEQIRGFKQHLSSVEGHQLRWQTGQDIFSDYLPWAVAFGLSERWVGLFDQLAEQGAYDVNPGWYVWAGMGHRHRFDSIGKSMQGLQTTGAAALSYTPGSSGGSGSFGGGGGSSGGGGGGGSFGGR